MCCWGTCYVQGVSAFAAIAHARWVTDVMLWTIIALDRARHMMSSLLLLMRCLLRGAPATNSRALAVDNVVWWSGDWWPTWTLKNQTSTLAEVCGRYHAVCRLTTFNLNGAIFCCCFWMYCGKIVSYSIFMRSTFYIVLSIRAEFHD